MCLRMSWVYIKLVNRNKQKKLLDVNRGRSLACFSKYLMV